MVYDGTASGSEALCRSRAKKILGAEGGLGKRSLLLMEVAPAVRAGPGGNCAGGACAMSASRHRAFTVASVQAKNHQGSVVLKRVKRGGEDGRSCRIGLDLNALNLV